MQSELTTTFIAFNAEKQIALDDAGNTWEVDGWYDIDGDELTDRWFDPEAPVGAANNVNWDEWEFVEIVTVKCKIDGKAVWANIRPDDFGAPSHG